MGVNAPKTVNRLCTNAFTAHRAAPTVRSMNES
jgi:hypothetical protein